jgi:hypothetical protein
MERDLGARLIARHRNAEHEKAQHLEVIIGFELDHVRLNEACARVEADLMGQRVDFVTHFGGEMRWHGDLAPGDVSLKRQFNAAADALDG